MSAKPVTAAIIGAGHRSLLYASYAKQHPEELQIVGIAEPDEIRRNKAIEAYELPADKCFLTAEELASQPQFADAAINGTMDLQHVPTTLPLLEAGYDVLLEKPICPTRDELLELLSTTRRTGRKLAIGHVLRYAPFYVAVRERVLNGEIGQLMSLQTVENVSYHHMATAFVRGKWNRRDTSNPMLLAKCCHDLDLISWMKSGVAPTRVASFGGVMYFREEMAPPGSGSRCLVDCEIESTCPYSANKHYIEQGLWPTYAWECIEHIENPTEEDKLASLRTDNPYGRCVWRCDNDVADHQGVVIEFADGSVATHNMNTGTSRPCRTMHLLGTTGEIMGTMEDGQFVVRHPDARKGQEYAEEVVDLNVSGAMHGGGDLRLVADFVRVVKGEQASISSTNIMDSINGHMIAFAADDAMLAGQSVSIGDLAGQ